MDYGSLPYRIREINFFENLFKDPNTCVTEKAEIVWIVQDKIERTVKKIKETKPEEFNKISYEFDWALKKLKNSYTTIKNFSFYQSSKSLGKFQQNLPSGKDYLRAYDNVLNALEVVRNLFIILDSSK